MTARLLPCCYPTATRLLPVCLLHGDCPYITRLLPVCYPSVTRLLPCCYPTATYLLPFVLFLSRFSTRFLENKKNLYLCSPNSDERFDNRSAKTSGEVGEWLNPQVC